jgi:hypothetical protein
VEVEGLHVLPFGMYIMEYKLKNLNFAFVSNAKVIMWLPRDSPVVFCVLSAPPHQSPSQRSTSPPQLPPDLPVSASG